MTTRLVVLNGGMRNPSTSKMLADQLTDATVSALTGSGAEVEVTTIDLRDHAHALADAMLTGFPAGALVEALDAVRQADAIIAVTPTFQASYSGLFKSFVDVIEPGSIDGVPVVLGASGGTERHSLMLEHALRPLFSYVGADPVRTAVFAATGDFGTSAGHELTRRIERAAAELVTRLGHRPVVAQARSLDDDLVPFEQMLAAVSR